MSSEPGSLAFSVVRHQRVINWVLVVCIGLLGLGSAAPSKAELSTGSAKYGSQWYLFFGWIVDPVPSLTETARLDFKINIDKVIYLRVGTGGNHSGGASGTGPAANAGVSTVTLNLTPSIPAGGTTPVGGSNQGASWNGAVPTFSATAVSLPVEVRSNAGAVKITGQVTSALTNGSNTVPMSSITITSSDSANLPAPVLPNSGTGAAVNVAPGGTGTAAAPTLLTYRTANWYFGFAPTGALLPGSYSGSVTFTASAL